MTCPFIRHRGIFFNPSSKCSSAQYTQKACMKILHFFILYLNRPTQRDIAFKIKKKIFKRERNLFYRSISKQDIGRKGSRDKKNIWQRNMLQEKKKTNQKRNYLTISTNEQSACSSCPKTFWSLLLSEKNRSNKIRRQGSNTSGTRSSYDNNNGLRTILIVTYLRIFKWNR